MRIHILYMHIISIKYNFIARNTIGNLQQFNRIIYNNELFILIFAAKNSN